MEALSTRQSLRFHDDEFLKHHCPLFPVLFMDLQMQQTVMHVSKTLRG